MRWTMRSTRADPAWRPAGETRGRRYRTSASDRVRRRGTPTTSAARAGPSASCRRCPRRRRPARSFPHPVHKTRRQSNRPYGNKNELTTPASAYIVARLGGFPRCMSDSASSMRYSRSSASCRSLIRRRRYHPVNKPQHVATTPRRMKNPTAVACEQNMTSF